MTTTHDTASAPVEPATSDPSHVPAGNGLAIASLVLGGTSLLAGWTFIAPIVGLVLGLLARKREPGAHAFANAGVILSAVALVGWVLAGLGVAAVGALAIGSRLLHY